MIGGNTIGILQVKTTTDNAIGEAVPAWQDVMELTGFLDLSGETTNRTTFNAKIQESTHIFICDYVPVPATLKVDGVPVRVTTENIRFAVLGQSYDVMLMDNPMFLNKHWEIYLKYTGGQ